MSDQIRVYVLGRFRLTRGAAPLIISPRSRKPRELLQMLVALGGTEVGAGALADALWPDSDGDAAYHALETALYRLRHLLGRRDLIFMEGGKLSLNRVQLWVDLWEFEEELQRCREARVGDGAIGRLRSLYQGHFLQHETEKPWVLKARHDVRDRLLRAIRDAARAYELASRWEDAADLYRSGIELEWLDEGLYQGLMRGQQELGNHSEALQAHRRCRELLMRFLGISPSDKTQALYLSVRKDATCARVASAL